MPDDDPQRTIRQSRLRHIWESYLNTVDERHKNGDVELLIDALKGLDWHGHTEISDAITDLLRKRYGSVNLPLESDAAHKFGTTKHYITVRNRELRKLYDINRAAGKSNTEIFEYLAKIYNIDVGAVRKVVERSKR